MRIAALLSAIGMLCAMATGATITQSVGFAGIPNFSKPLTFDSFDTTAGTLDSVSIMVNQVVTSGQVFVDNESPLPAFVTVALETDAALSSGEVFFPPVKATVLVSQALSLAGDDGDGPSIDPTGMDGGVVSFVNAAGSDSILIVRISGPTQAAQVATFENTHAGDDFIISLDSSTSLKLDGTGGIAGGFTPAYLAGDVTVIYDYDPGVPEPASVVLMAAGAMWLALRRRAAR